jgi:hypothetical protein
MVLIGPGRKPARVVIAIRRFGHAYRRHLPPEIVVRPRQSMIGSG